MRHFRFILVWLAASTLLAACGSTRSLDPRTWFSRDTTPPPAAREMPGVEARLKSLGSAMNGVVRARETGDLLVVRVELSNVKPGAAHRVVFHANGNCSSPNGFSAGAQWSPPGAKDPPGRLIPEAYADTNGTAILTARIKGVRLGGTDGLEKRAVLVYEGSKAEPPRPSVPNDVIACGVFEKSTQLFAP